MIHIPDSIEETYQHREWFPVLRRLGVTDANVWQTAHALERFGIRPTEFRQALAAYVKDRTLVHPDGNDPEEMAGVFDAIRAQFIRSLHGYDHDPSPHSRHLPPYA